MNPFKALVVDDEKDVELLFRQRFRREIRSGRIHFHFAYNGQDALDFLNGSDTTDVVLVLSDINMPGMTGLELLRRLKEAFPHLPVHMITAYGDERNHRIAMEYGADGYLNKPLDFRQLKQDVFGLGPEGPA